VFPLEKLMGPQVVGFRRPKQVSGLASRQVLRPARQECLPEQPFQTLQPQLMGMLLLRQGTLVSPKLRLALPLQISRLELLSCRHLYQQSH
jgi:hypothetical protein